MGCGGSWPRGRATFWGAVAEQRKVSGQSNSWCRGVCAGEEYAGERCAGMCVWKVCRVCVHGGRAPCRGVTCSLGPCVALVLGAARVLGEGPNAQAPPVFKGA